MLLEEKLEKSTVVKKVRKRASGMGIQTKKQKIMSLVILLATIIYSFAIPYIFKSDDQKEWFGNYFNLSFIFVGINSVAMILFKIFDKSIVQLNHNHFYKFIIFICKLSKVMITALSFMAFYNYFDKYCLHNHQMHVIYYLGNLIENQTFSLDYFLSLDYELVKKIFTFIFTFIVFIPTLFYFIIISFKYGIYIYVYYICAMILMIPVLNIVLFFKYLFSENNKFKYYEFEDESKKRSL